MTALRDTGRAKLNLTLDVLGRRADGFHELNSLVAFATLGDRGRVRAGTVRSSLSVEGPFARTLGRRQSHRQSRREPPRTWCRA